MVFIKKNKRVILSFLEIIKELLVIKDNPDYTNFIMGNATSKYAIFLNKITILIDRLKDVKTDSNDQETTTKELNHDHIAYIIIFLILTIKSEEIIAKIERFNDLINTHHSSISCIIIQIIKVLEDTTKTAELEKIIIKTIFKKKIVENLTGNDSTLNHVVFKTISILDNINKFQIIEKTIIVDCEVIIINELLNILGDKVTKSVTNLIQNMTITINNKIIPILDYTKSLIHKDNNNIVKRWSDTLYKMLNIQSMGGKTIKRNKKILNRSRKIRR
jgi:hypothetical protein